MLSRKISACQSHRSPPSPPRASPVSLVEHPVVRCLMSHGVLDPLATVEQSRHFVDGVEKNGVPVTYTEFPDEGHRIEKQVNREKVAITTLEFFDSQLK